MWTKGTDGDVLVVLVPPDDHPAMSRLFFQMDLLFHFGIGWMLGGI